MLLHFLFTASHSATLVAMLVTWSIPFPVEQLK